MEDYGLTPRPPQWTLDAGLPEPHDDESFLAYVTRLGYSGGELLADLDERTMSLANVRLATKLQRSMPVEFDKHVDRLVDKHGTRQVRFRRPVPMA
jgi:hypothetical protein